MFFSDENVFFLPFNAKHCVCAPLYHHTKIKKFILSQKTFLIENECKATLYSFSIKNIFHGKIDLRLFYLLDD